MAPDPTPPAEKREPIGVSCAGRCGRHVVPVEANDSVGSRGPWYCDECFAREKVKREPVSAETLEKMVEAGAKALRGFDEFTIEYRAQSVLEAALPVLLASGELVPGRGLEDRLVAAFDVGAEYGLVTSMGPRPKLKPAEKVEMVRAALSGSPEEKGKR